MIAPSATPHSNIADWILPVPQSFEGVTFTQEDDRAAYGETRFITVGVLDNRMIVMVWTLRGEVRRIISLRKANEREQVRYQSRLG